MSEFKSNTILFTSNPEHKNRFGSDLHKAIIIDLQEAIDKYREIICDTPLAEDFNDDCEEINAVLPYIRHVKYDFSSSKLEVNTEKSPMKELTVDVLNMFAAMGEENAKIISFAHWNLAMDLLNVFIEIGLFTELGFNPYVFVKRLSPDAFLFINDSVNQFGLHDGKLEYKIYNLPIPERRYRGKKIGNIIFSDEADEKANQEIVEDPIKE